MKLRTNTLYFSFLVITLTLFSSCSKITPDKNINNVNKSVSGVKDEVNKSGEACGIITCKTMDNLSKLALDGKLNLPNLNYYKERFSIIAKKYTEKDKLLSSDEFKKFTEDLNIDFFSCPGDFHKCEPKDRNYGYNETNYLFYVFIPTLVIEEYEENKNLSEIDKEDIIQSIKRKDYLSLDIKEDLIARYLENLKNKVNNMNFSYIDKNKLLGDKEYFNQIILAPQKGLYDTLINESQHTGINWQSEEQMEEIIEGTINIFFDKLKQFGIDKKQFNKMVNIKDIIKNLEANTNYLNTKYELSKKMPIDRFYRNDELYIFNDKNIKDFEINVFGNEKNFINKALEIRHDTYLLFLLGEEKNLFFLPNRMNVLDFDNKFIATNIFEYTKNQNFDTKY